ncbi:MAG: efflux RND transporter permease subunit, partial [Desulfobacterales bacterium]
GKTRQDAARVGADQVAWPVITSTLTTLGAFSPMMFWPGIMGEFMGYLPMTLIMALSASLFVALIINPVLSARYQKVKPVKSKGNPHPKEPIIKRFYLFLLKWCLRHRWVVVLSSFVMLVAALTAFSLFGKGTEFFPETEPKRAYVNIKAPEGTNLDTSDKLVAQVEKIVSQYEDIRYVISNIGSVGGDPFSQGGTGTHISRVVLDFKDFHDRSQPSSEIVNEVRQRILKTIEGAEVQVEKEEEGPPTGPPINIEISGEDIFTLGELAAAVRKEIRDIAGLVDLKDNFVKGKPEIRVRVDKEKAALMGLDTYTIAYTVKAAINGVKAGVYREGKDEYDIIARLPERDRRSIENLKRITVSGPRGEPIPLTSLAEISLGSGIGAIMRLDQKRVVTISGDVSGRLANDVIKDIDARLQKNITWPRGYAYRFSGEQEEQAKAQAFLSKAFFACIAIILLILMTQFDSFITPFIIITSVILSLIGVFIGLLVTGTAFGIIMTGIGVISLAGVVVNNAIVLIDYYNQLLAKGIESFDALIRAGSVRFRPVLLTAITTILGLLPMATGVSFDFRKMAVAVIFGLGFATLLTLIVVPVLCSMAHSVKTRKMRTQKAS